MLRLRFNFSSMALYVKSLVHRRIIRVGCLFSSRLVAINTKFPSASSAFLAAPSPFLPPPIIHPFPQLL